MSRCALILAICFLLTTSAAAQHALRADTFKVIHTYPHDANAFTQGLIYQDGHLYESTGLTGKSSVRIVDLTSGRVLKQYDLAGKYFGEGLTNWGNELIQLTWQAQLGFVYDRATLAWKKSFSYKGEGWGLTHDDQQLILSDGTPELRFLDPQSFAEKRRVTVTDEKGQPVLNLNELEYIHGEIYANIWQTDEIIRISPQTGKVVGRIDLTGLIDKSELASSDAVLNGVAYDAKTDRLFVTGKLWPKLFEIKVVHRSR
jgi:glutamine cyclotransferase